MKHNLKNNLYFLMILQTLLAFSFSLLIIILIVKLTLNLKAIYYLDIVHLNIPKLSNLELSEIKSNYDYVIEYMNSSSLTRFNLPSLPYSLEGKIHFEEVKIIFNFLDNLAYVLAFTVLILFIPNYKKKNYKFLKLTSIYLLVLPMLCLVPFLVDFDKSFTLFHKVFFNNDYWLLDPKNDPIINMMPQAFFFHCAIFIITFLIISSTIFYFIYRKLKKSLKN